ncbi:malto-oligosyltrehalose synthase, partial [mine drainage metagenome]
MRPTPVPGSAYRLQLHGGFSLSRVTGLVDYLTGLGIRTLYLSPLLQARRGSSHGYDVT